ncbi:hypothetical protein D3C77_613590 [compost metagenome]
MNNKLCILNKIEITLDRAKYWDSVLPTFPANEQQLRSNLSAARAFIDQYGKGGGMKRTLTSSNSFDKEVSRLLAEQSRLLLHALSEGSMKRAVQEATRLIGLGFGLTPSGDDFLVGLFAVFNMPECPIYEIKSFCSEVVSVSEDEPTILAISL